MKTALLVIIVCLAASSLNAGGKGKGNDNDKHRDNHKNCTHGSVSVPEPGTMLLLASGLAGLGVMRRKKSKLTD